MTIKPVVEQFGPPTGSTSLRIEQNTDHNDRFKVVLTTDFGGAMGVMRRSDLVELANNILATFGAA